MNGGDRFGVGWRPELAAPIFAHLDRIDVVEVIADDYCRAAPKQVRALRTLSRQLPVTLHGVGLGLATACPLEPRRLDSMARLVDAVCPRFETFLALIYTDAEARRRFLDDPLEEAARAGLTTDEARALASIDREGLKLAARSFERKRAARQAHRK